MTKGCNGSSVTQSVYIIVEDVPLDHGGSLHQHHHLQAVRPSSVEPSPQQSVALTKPRAARPLPAQNGHVMSESQHLKFQGARRRNRKETRETIADRIVSMPVTIKRSAQKSNVYRAHGIMSSHRLAMASSIIRDHGGRIWARQNPNRGATFEFELHVEKRSP